MPPARPLAQAQNQVVYTDLKASENGIVTAVTADVGQVVGAGTPVMTVAVDGEKEVLIAVPEMDIAEFKPGKDVKAGFWSDDALALDGKVREVAGSADQQSRTFAVRVSLPDDPRVLLGMTANIEASVANEAGDWCRSRSARWRRRMVSKIVWTVDRAGETVHARPVKVAEFTADGVSVADGLKPGDVVVAAGTQFMTENLKVKLTGDAAQQSASAEGDAARPCADGRHEAGCRRFGESAGRAIQGFRAASARWSRRQGRCSPASILASHRDECLSARKASPPGSQHRNILEPHAEARALTINELD